MLRTLFRAALVGTLIPIVFLDLLFLPIGFPAIFLMAVLLPVFPFGLAYLGVPSLSLQIPGIFVPIFLNVVLYVLVAFVHRLLKRWVMPLLM